MHEFELNLYPLLQEEILCFVPLVVQLDEVRVQEEQLALVGQEVNVYPEQVFVAQSFTHEPPDKWYPVTQDVILYLVPEVVQLVAVIVQGVQLALAGQEESV